MKTSSFVFSVVALTACYAGFLFYEKQQSKIVNTPPVISISSDTLEISVKDGEKELLEGVTAQDQEDGNLSDQVKVLNISSFDENRERTVTYVVYDRKDEMAMKTRKIKYSDYSIPEFVLNHPMMYNYVPSDQELVQWIDVHSGLDKGLKNNLEVQIDWKGDSKAEVTYSVTDSTGTTVSEKYPFTYLTSNFGYNIELSRYSLIVPTGTALDYRSYIEGLSYGGTSLDYLSYLITIDTDYNPNEPGIYEVYYRIDRGGEAGVTKLIVRVVGGA